MKIKNKNIIATKNILLKLNLKGTQQRLRTRFCKQLEEYEMKTYRTEKSEIANKFAERDYKGEIVYISEGTFNIPEENVNDYMSELRDLEEDIFEIENTEGNKMMLQTVANIILDEDLIEVSGHDAYVHDDLCEECELVLEFYKL